MQIEKITPYTQKEDERGLFTGITNVGPWHEVNYLQTKAGAVRGNHYHKEIKEFVFIVKGHVLVEFESVKVADKIKFELRSGEGVIIHPYVLHTFFYVTDCEQISFLDSLFDPASPDLFSRNSL